MGLRVTSPTSLPAHLRLPHLSKKKLLTSPHVVTRLHGAVRPSTRPISPRHCGHPTPRAPHPAPRRTPIPRRMGVHCRAPSTSSWPWHAKRHHHPDTTRRSSVIALDVPLNTSLMATVVPHQVGYGHRRYHVSSVSNVSDLCFKCFV